MAPVNPSTVASTVAQAWVRMLACCGVALSSTSHSTRNTTRTASCVKRTMRWPRRSRASQARYCGLGEATVSASTFDMDFELLPQRVEIAVEFGRVARRQGRQARPVSCRKADRMIGLHSSGPAREHDYPLRHAHRLANVVGHQDCGLLLPAQDHGDFVGERQPRL